MTKKKASRRRRAGCLGSLVVIVIAGVLFRTCSVITITRSTKREAQRKTILLSPDCSIASTGAVYMNLAGVKKADFLPAGVKILFRDKLIYIDPLVAEDTRKADFIFITHNHPDHFSLPDIKKLVKPETIIVAPGPVAKRPGACQVRQTRIGDTFQWGDIGYKAVAAYNVKKHLFSLPVHKRSDRNVGYIISCDTLRIYHAGDTDLIPEMNDLGHLTLALVPIGEGKTAMTPSKAAAAVNRLHPLIAIPIHYEIGKNSTAGFQQSVHKDILVRLFRQPAIKTNQALAGRK